jgi:hypothetical protein
MVSRAPGDLLPRLAEAVGTRRADLAIVPRATRAPSHDRARLAPQHAARRQYRELGERIARSEGSGPRRKSSGKSTKSK